MPPEQGEPEDDRALHEKGAHEPQRRVRHGDEARHVVRQLRVVPGTRSQATESEAARELPHVDPREVHEASDRPV